MLIVIFLRLIAFIILLLLIYVLIDMPNLEVLYYKIVYHNHNFINAKLGDKVIWICDDSVNIGSIVNINGFNNWYPIICEFSFGIRAFDCKGRYEGYNDSKIYYFNNPFYIRFVKRLSESFNHIIKKIKHYFRPFEKLKLKVVNSKIKVKIVIQSEVINIKK